MRVRHLNCATLHPRGVRGGGRDGRRGRTRDAVVCHCLLVETPEDGLALVDTGLGLEDIRRPAERLGRRLPFFLRPELLEEETALRQVESLGFEARDVRHILLTHLHPDHAGGLSDFPRARVHVLESEYQAAMNDEEPARRRGYRRVQFQHRPLWVRYSALNGRWFEEGCVGSLIGLPEGFVLLPLPGHTAGHAGVAVREEDGWLIHAGDAYVYHGEVDPIEPNVPPEILKNEESVQVDGAQRIASQEKLRRILRRYGDEVRTFCTHDPAEFKLLRDGAGGRAQTGS